MSLWSALLQFLQEKLATSSSNTRDLLSVLKALANSGGSGSFSWVKAIFDKDHRPEVKAAAMSSLKKLCFKNRQKVGVVVPVHE